MEMKFDRYFALQSSGLQAVLVPIIYSCSKYPDIDKIRTMPLSMMLHKQLKILRLKFDAIHLFQIEMLR